MSANLLYLYIRAISVALHSSKVHDNCNRYHAIGVLLPHHGHFSSISCPFQVMWVAMITFLQGVAHIFTLHVFEEVHNPQI